MVDQQGDFILWNDANDANDANNACDVCYSLGVLLKPVVVLWTFSFVCPHCLHSLRTCGIDHG